MAHWQLRHPNIVSLIGIYQFEEESFPAMILQRAEHSLAIKYLESHPDSRSFLKLVSSYLIFPQMPNAYPCCEHRFWAYLMEYVTCIQGYRQSFTVTSTMSVLIPYLHSAFYIHIFSKRNVFVSRTGDCLLCDFGLSRIRHEISRTYTTIHQGDRQRFIAPEISSGLEPESMRSPMFILWQ